MLLCEVHGGESCCVSRGRAARPPAGTLLCAVPHAVRAAQIMTGDVHDVPAIISSKGGLKYAGADVDAMRAVAKAYENRSLHEFQAALTVSERGAAECFLLPQLQGHSLS